uniref:Uncharacterized protein n=1 Tax=Leersia perrieri TaxID=77586 RepID=A0A0D9VLQ1_9ORYZ
MFNGKQTDTSLANNFTNILQLLNSTNNPITSCTYFSMSRSVGTMARAFAMTQDCTPKSVILYPGKPCDPTRCSSDCSDTYKGTGTCIGQEGGCKCDYCE